MSTETEISEPDLQPRVEFDDWELLDIVNYAVDDSKVYRVRSTDPVRWIEIKGDRLKLIVDTTLSLFAFMRGCASQQPPKGDGVLSIVRLLPMLEYPSPDGVEPMWDGSEEFILF
jgi:hypothetical protein